MGTAATIIMVTCGRFRPKRPRPGAAPPQSFFRSASAHAAERCSSWHSRALGLFGAGIVATFAMAVGTGVTVSLLAVLAFGSRRLALRLAGGEALWLRRINIAIGLLGGAALLLLGTLMLVASLQQAPTPFR